MDSALIVSAFLMGAAGAPHCAAMCGAACGAVAARGAGAGPSRIVAVPMLALHAGRIAGYAAMGALAAASVGSLGTFADAAPVVRPLWSLVHVAAIVLGGWLLWFGRAPAWLSPDRRRSAEAGTIRPVRFMRRMPASARAGAAGLAWTIMPCGLLQSALLVAALASSPAGGASAMAAFALASTLGLVFAQRLWSTLRGRGGENARRAVWPVRAAGALLAGSSLFALANGLGAALCGVAA